MSTSQLITRGYPAAASMAAYEGYAAKIDTAGRAAVQASAGGEGIGVIVANPTLPTAIDQAVSIAGFGQTVKCRCGAAVTRGDKISIDSAGLFVTYSSGVAWGTAETSTTASGQYFYAVLAKS